MNMVKIKDIREDLNNIRYYYSRKKMLDEAFRSLGYNSIVKKVEVYNELIKEASPQLFDLYVSLYINNNTQEALSEAMCYTRETVNLLNKKLLLYFQEKLNQMEGGEENVSM